MNRFLRKGAERGARDLTVGYSIGTADPSTFSAIEAALNHQQERRHHLAEEGYQAILVKDPDNRDALFLYGTLKLLFGDYEEASQLLKRSVEVDPNFGEGWSAYGSALTSLGQHEEAIMVFHRALDSSPKLAEAHYHLARLHKAMREWDNGIMHFRNAIGLDRAHAHAYSEMAECYLELGQYDEAMAACHSAIMLDKRLVKAYNTLGRALNGLGQTKAAEETFRTAIKLDPSYAEAYSNLGAAFLSLGRPAEALEACIQANQLNDNLAIAHCTRGESLRQLGRLDEAMQACQRAFTIDPDSADGLNRLGTVYLESSMTDEAVVSFQKAFTIRHHNKEAFSNYISALKCKQGTTDEQILGAAKDFAARFAFTDATRPPKPTGIRRVGVLTGAVEDSPLGAALDALEDGCRQLGLEVAVYTDDAARGPRVERLSKKATVWRSVTGIDDETVRDLIRDDKVDVLVDMCGHSEGNRLGVLVNHAAPVQVTWFGGYGTVGLPQVDAAIVDAVTVPEGTDQNWSEKVIRLGRPWMCMTPPEQDVPVVDSPTLSGEPFTFGSFNRTKKINRQVVAAWSEILRRVPESRLMIKSRSLASGALRRQYLSWFLNNGIETDRIIFRQATTKSAHFASYNQVDLCLDTFPATGSATTFETLWMGVPLVTLRSDCYNGRLSASILKAIGHVEWVTTSADEYIEKAVAMAGDVSALNAARHGMRGKLLVSPLCDSVGFVREFMTKIAASL